MRNPRIVLAMSNVSMALGHDGLRTLASKHGLELDTLQPGDLALFMNTQRDKLKMIGAKGIVLGYLRMPKGQKMPLEAVQYIPRAFASDGSVSLDKAIRTHLAERLLKRGTVGSSVEFERIGAKVSDKRTYKLADAEGRVRSKFSDEENNATI